MTPRSIRVLHVEDDSLQQKVVEHHLKQIPDLLVGVTCARSEEEALAEFGRRPADVVLLDYHLSQGDGLSCLRRLRQLDAVVPIVAISGQATPEIAAQLLQSGADDYISKRDLRSDGLGKSIRMALVRADAWRRSTLPIHESEDPLVRFRASLLHLGKAFLNRLDPAFLGRLDACETLGRQGKLGSAQVPRIFEGVCAELAAARPGDEAVIRKLLRPLCLEIQRRVASDSV